MAALYQVDAFTEEPFGGNPAAVCLLDRPRDPAWMQRFAAEMNLSETAFVHPVPEGHALRWFTPAVEVELCGHATLASAHAMWAAGVMPADQPIRFVTASGHLTANRAGQRIELDFPATPAEVMEATPELCQILGAEPLWCGRNQFDKLLVVASEEQLRALRPDFERMRQLPDRGMIVTSRAEEHQAYDFVSRYFAPAAGIDEDPVTGSAHCTLAPYWAEQLGKRTLVGFQASQRGGVVHVDWQGDRVKLSGQAVTVFRGELLI